MSAKSTPFNRLTRTCDALVADQPGLTRDRHYGIGRVGDRDYLVVDTWLLDLVATDGIMHEMARQAEQAIAEADVLLFLVTAAPGAPRTTRISPRAAIAGRPVHVVVNKAEGIDRAMVAADFHALGPASAAGLGGARRRRQAVGRARACALPGRRREGALRRREAPRSPSSVVPTSANPPW